MCYEVFLTTQQPSSSTSPLISVLNGFPHIHHDQEKEGKTIINMLLFSKEVRAPNLVALKSWLFFLGVGPIYTKMSTLQNNGNVQHKLVTTN